MTNDADDCSRKAESDAANSAKAEAPPKKSVWDKAEFSLKVITTLAIPAIIWYFGDRVNNTVDLALRREELELSNAAAMRDLLVDFRKPEQDEAYYQSTALALSAFGKPAAPSLLMELDRGSHESRAAAATALRLVGLTHPEQVCDLLRRVIDDRNQSFGPQAHLAVIQLLGQLNCAEAIGSLARYSEFVRSDSDSSRQQLGEIFRDGETPSVGMTNKMKGDVERSLRVLRRTREWRAQ